MRAPLTVILFLLFLPLARAFNYQDKNLLLTFRKDGFDDVLFNLGPIDPLLNLPAGSRVVLTNWDLNQVLANYPLDGDVRVILLATTPRNDASPRAWLSAVPVTPLPLNRTASQWQGLYSVINAVGAKAQAYSQSSPTNVFIAPPTLPSSYTFIVSSGGSLASALPTLGGNSTFKVESGIPATLNLLEVKPSTANPKPPTTLVGVFSLDTNGALTFTAGAPQPAAPVQIGGIQVTAAGVVVSFPSVVGSNYRLRYSASPTGDPATWSAGATVAGTGGQLLLTDPASADSQRYYAVETY